MFELNGIQLSILEVFLMASVILLAVFSFVNQRRVSRLELLLSSSQTATSREIKMVNQGAIGLGRRFARIEKELKKPSNVARFEAPKETTPSQFKPVAQAVSKPVKQQPKAIKPKTLGKATRAEQALSAWINENKTA